MLQEGGGGRGFPDSAIVIFRPLSNCRCVDNSIITAVEIGNIDRGTEEEEDVVREDVHLQGQVQEWNPGLREGMNEGRDIEDDGGYGNLLLQKE